MMTMILMIFAINPARIIQFFDKTGEFTPLAVWAFPFVSVLVFLDLIQLILAGALRGAGNVRMVMQTRLLVCIGFFVPVSYLLSTMQMPTFTKFILIYSSFYVGNALMSVVYIRRFRSDVWQVSSTEGNI
jgi:Na+-driven multidrug efflux pump